MRHDPTFWLLARASGLTAYVTADLLRPRRARSQVPAVRARVKALPSVTDVHRFLAMLGLGLLVATRGGARARHDREGQHRRRSSSPGSSSYRPVWTSVGILTAELMVLVYASFSLRKRIGNKNWRRLHWATYGIFAAATIHGIGAGTDSSRPWAFALYLGAVGSVAAATTWRALVSPAPARARRARPAAGAAPPRTAGTPAG